MHIQNNTDQVHGISPCIIDSESTIPNEIGSLHVDYLYGVRPKLSPEKEMWLSALTWAINEYLNSPVESVQLAAEAWIMADDEEFNSFNSICGIFGFNPAAIREAILKLEKKRIIRIRPNRGHTGRRVRGEEFNGVTRGRPHSVYNSHWTGNGR